MVVKQLAEFTRALGWYDYNDEICKASEISNTVGKYVVADESKDCFFDGAGNYLSVSDKPLDAPFVEAYYTFVTEDTSVINKESKVTIVPVELLISFSTENENITDVKVFNANYFTNDLSEYNCKACPESIVTFVISLKTGKTFPESSIKAIEYAFGTSAEKILNISGRATISIKMSYKAVTFKLYKIMRDIASH